MASINSALSGLMAAQTRLNVSANNTVNARSTGIMDDGAVEQKPFAPQKVEAISLAEGGVESVVLPVEPATIGIYDPANRSADSKGVVQYPNVDESEENLQRLTAEKAYKANLKVLETDQEMGNTLLDV